MFEPIEIVTDGPYPDRLGILITPLSLCERLSDAGRVKRIQLTSALALSVTDDGRVVDVYADVDGYHVLDDGGDTVTITLSDPPARFWTTDRLYPGVDVSQCAKTGKLFRVVARRLCRR